MKTYTVVFTPEAEEQLVTLYCYIEENASAEIALRYTSAVVEHCESLGCFAFARAAQALRHFRLPVCVLRASISRSVS